MNGQGVIRLFVFDQLPYGYTKYQEQQLGNPEHIKGDLSLTTLRVLEKFPIHLTVGVLFRLRYSWPW